MAPQKTKQFRLKTLRFRSFFGIEEQPVLRRKHRDVWVKGSLAGAEDVRVTFPLQKKWFIWFIVHPPQDPETYFNPKQSPGTGRNIVFFFLLFLTSEKKGVKKSTHFIQLQVAHLWSKDWGGNGMWPTWLAKRLVGCVFYCAKKLGEDRRVEWVCLFVCFFFVFAFTW